MKIKNDSENIKNEIIKEEKENNDEKSLSSSL